MDAGPIKSLQDKYVVADGLRLRYIECGNGTPALFLHGASLGSSADVFVGNLAQFAAAGFRAVAFDLPGFGLSETPERQSVKKQRDSIPGFIRALKLDPVRLIAHSRAGGFALDLALAEPDLISHVVILGTGSLLPPQDETQLDRHATAQTRADQQMAAREPTLADTRKLLVADVFNQALITEEVLALRHSRSIGQNFLNHVARQTGDGGAGRGSSDAKPAWQKLGDLTMPLLMIFGREDRAHAADRAELLKRLNPKLNIHVVPHCKHLVPWDAADELLRLAVPFLRPTGAKN